MKNCTYLYMYCSGIGKSSDLQTIPQFFLELSQRYIIGLAWAKLEQWPKHGKLNKALDEVITTRDARNVNFICEKLEIAQDARQCHKLASYTTDAIYMLHSQ